MLSCVRDVSVDRCVCDVTCWRRRRSGTRGKGSSSCLTTTAGARCGWWPWLLMSRCRHRYAVSVCVCCLCGVWTERVCGSWLSMSPCRHRCVNGPNDTHTHTHTHTHMQVRDWLDDPYADEAAMAKLLRHPLVAQQLSTPDVMPEPVVLPVAT